MLFQWMSYELHSPEDEQLYWKARKKLNMTEESVTNDVENIRSWLKTHPYLPRSLHCDDRIWLENYLLLNKNDLERTKCNLDMYFKIRTILPNAFKERDPNFRDMQKSFASTCVAPIPKLTSEGHMICVYHHFTSDASQFEMIPLGKRLIAMIDIQLARTRISRTGTIIICDLFNSRVSHLTKYRPLKLVRIFFNSVWRAYPERVVKVHIINPPTGFSLLLAFFKPFIKSKIIDRITVHASLESLYKWIPKSHLPKDYGGDCPSLEELNRRWERILLDNADWLEISAKEHKIEDSKWPSEDQDTSDDLLAEVKRF